MLVQNVASWEYPGLVWEWEENAPFEGIVKDQWLLSK